MIIFLIIIGILALFFIILAIAVINDRRTRFFNGKLKPLEKKLFAELETRLPASAGMLIPKQLAKLTEGSRLYFSKSYTLDLYTHKNNPLEEDSLFTRKDEFKLATLAFTHTNIQYTAEFKTYAGRICE